MDDSGSPDQEVADEQSRDDNCYSDHDDEETLDLDEIAPDDIRLFEDSGSCHSSFMNFQRICVSHK